MSRIASFLKAVASPPTLNRSRALALSERLSAVTHLIASLEHLVNEPDRKPGGFNNWERMRGNHVRSPAPIRKALDAVAAPGTTRALHMARIGAAVTLLAPVPLPRRARLAADAVLATSSLGLYARHHYGSDGADQVSFLVSGLTAVARAGERDPRVVDACLWFISMQSSLSYAVSGWVKMTSPTWRSGRAMPGVFRTITYGDHKAWELIRRHPKKARALGAAVLALECGFPLAYAAKGRFAPALVASVGAFHLANARFMALGRFLWAFGSMHPAVLYTAGPKHRTSTSGRPELRDDTMAYAGLAALAVAAGAALAAARHRRAVVLAGRGDESSIVTSVGNTLTYRLVGAQADPRQPLIVVETGLAGPVEQWEWVVQSLARRHEVVTYRRAGYGASRRADDHVFELDHAVDDLLDLVAQVAGERPVVLLGHSLGGYLVWKAAARLPGRFTALGLIDPSHPAELQRSARQSAGEQAVSDLLTAASISLSLGLGPMLDIPSWTDQLPPQARRLFLAEFRDARLWEAGRREWKAAQAEFRAFDGELPAVDVPALVLTAEYTARQDKEQQEMHDELVRAAPGSVRHQIDGADHDRILADPAAARQVTDLIERFMQDAARTNNEENRGV
ncbi:MAG TPA: alpha/beta fold hydrolase [Actinospica sp.]|nr:alpha/beta fold hydrolase [Actinospica sp.]